MLESVLPQMPSSLTLLGVVLVLFLLYLLSSTTGPGKEPPGPRPLPLLGNLLLLDLKRPHVSLCELSKKYGSVFTIHFGIRKAVILAGYKTVKQALVDYAEEFGDRYNPPMSAEYTAGYGILHSNGNCFKELKRFSLSNLRKFGMGKKGSERIIEECHYLIKVFENFKGEPFDTAQSVSLTKALFRPGINIHPGRSDLKWTQSLHSWHDDASPSAPFNTTQSVYCSVSNIISSILYGSRFEYSDPALQRNIDLTIEIVLLLGSAEIQLYNSFPWLRRCCGWWLVNRAKVFTNMRNHIDQIKGLVQGLKDTLNSQEPRGFVDSFLVRQLEESDQFGSYFHVNNLHHTVRNLFLAGTDTTASTLRWGLLLMAKYPHIQDQVQEELSRVIGDREPGMEDRRNLPYTDAVIHEIQRLANIVPMSLPHKTSCDVIFQGHFIKKGTTVIPLLASVLQDEEEWETPHSFNPGHFLDEKGCFIKRDAFMPFSAGRRACPGEGLARTELFLFFTILLQRFRFTPPPGVSEDELDLTPVVGFTLIPSPHLLCAVSRA